MTDQSPTPEEIENMRKAVADFDAKRIEDAKASAAERVKAARDLASSDALAEVVAGAKAARDQLREFDTLSSLLKNIVDTAGLLGQFIDNAERELVNQATAA